MVSCPRLVVVDTTRPRRLAESVKPRRNAAGADARPAYVDNNREHAVEDFSLHAPFLSLTHTQTYHQVEPTVRITRYRDENSNDPCSRKVGTMIIRTERNIYLS